MFTLANVIGKSFLTIDTVGGTLRVFTVKHEATALLYIDRI